jgi:two-component system chemotaxis response regulator CheY
MPAPYTCLVVEDSPMMRQLLVLALSRVKNLRVTEADDGVDGLRKLAGGKFDIIITDINMPIMDGLKLVKRVRSDPTHKDVPIIVITTEGSSEDRQRERVHHQADPGAAGHRQGQGAAPGRGLRCARRERRDGRAAARLGRR